ncbi:hypothetical protein [Sphingomonas sp. YL-JM2C]
MAGHDPWSGALFGWADQPSWYDRLSSWLAPYLGRGAQRRLTKTPAEHLYLDDLGWLARLDDVLTEPVEAVTAALAADLASATLRVFHGSRVANAGVFHRDGLRRRDRAALGDDIRDMLDRNPEFNWERASIEERLDRAVAEKRDASRSYLGLDGRFLVEECGHYLLYGSEWMQGVLGWSAQAMLLRTGVPTLIEIGLPLQLAEHGGTNAVADRLLHEWSRQQVARDGRSPLIDCTLTLDQDIAGEAILSHSHPRRIFDPLHHVWRSNAYADCPACKPKAPAETGDDGESDH